MWFLVPGLILLAQQRNPSMNYAISCSKLIFAICWVVQKMAQLLISDKFQPESGLSRHV